MAILKKKTTRNEEDIKKRKITMPNSTMMSVKVLKIEERYQRLIDLEQVRQIRDEFDPYLFQPLTVCERNGEYYIVDGWHRFYAVKDSVEEVPCVLWRGLTYSGECKRFREINTKRKALNASVVFHSMVEEGNLEAIDVVKILKRNGFAYNRYNQTAKENVIGSPAKMLRLYKTNGADLLDRTLMITRKAWHGIKESLLVVMLTGLNTFLRENEMVDDAILVKALSKFPPEIIRGRATYYITADKITGISGGDCKYIYVANAIKEIYNKQAPKKLQIA